MGLGFSVSGLNLASGFRVHKGCRVCQARRETLLKTAPSPTTATHTHYYVSRFFNV